MIYVNQRSLPIKLIEEINVELTFIKLCSRFIEFFVKVSKDFVTLFLHYKFVNPN